MSLEANRIEISCITGREVKKKEKSEGPKDVQFKGEKGMDCLPSHGTYIPGQPLPASAEKNNVMNCHATAANEKAAVEKQEMECIPCHEPVTKEDVDKTIADSKTAETKPSSDWEAVREQRRDEAKVDTVQDAITKDRKASGETAFYTVKSGDTIWDIAESCKDTGQYKDTSVKDLSAKIMDFNGISDPRKLRVGQKIKFPPPVEKADTTSEIKVGPANIDPDKVTIKTGDNNPIVNEGPAFDDMKGNLDITTGDNSPIYQDGPIVGDMNENVAITTGNKSPIEQDGPIIGDMNKNVAISTGNQSPVDQDGPIFGNMNDNIGISAGDKSPVTQDGPIFGNMNGNIGVTLGNESFVKQDGPIFGNMNDNVAVTAGNDSKIYQDGPIFGEMDRNGAVTFGNNANIEQEGPVFGSMDENYAATVGNNSGILQDGPTFGDFEANEAVTLGKNSNIEQDGSFWGDTEVKAETYGKGSDIKQSGSVFGSAIQDAASAFGNITQTGSWFGDTEQNMELEGDGAKGVQETYNGADEVKMSVAANNTTTKQSTGADKDEASYTVSGSGNSHTMLLGSNNDKGYLFFDNNSSRNEIVLRGGDDVGGFDARKDTFNVKLAGKNNIVHANPVNTFLGIGHSDTLNLFVEGNYEIREIKDGGTSHVLIDENGNKVYIGKSIETLKIMSPDGQILERREL